MDRSTEPTNRVPTARTTTPSDQSTLDRLDRLTDGKTRPPRVEDLPPPPSGFTAADVEALATRAIDIAERGVSPDLEGRSPSEAFDFVFAGQYPQTTDYARTNSRRATTGYDWEWAWASLYEDPAAAPAIFLTSRWEVARVPGKLDDGSQANQLQVTLVTATEQIVDDKRSGVRAPIVMVRSIILRSFKPRGGPAWWPGVGVQAEPLLGGKCAPKNDSLLTPSYNDRVLDEDFEKLADVLREVKDVEEYASSDADSIAAYLKKYCDD
ncbi:hypothetical protein [Nocardioides sp.]|uniref:hypothetical protein n=1 Tax=Nocardioides sp. TaxID=35761 RepID=UPI00271C07CA|nr:hypothetical protein [Nocardioides sp.]MDO9455236.1 hypothetical protein [Nocardioides sp.]